MQRATKLVAFSRVHGRVSTKRHVIRELRDQNMRQQSWADEAAFDGTARLSCWISSTYAAREANAARCESTVSRSVSTCASRAYRAEQHDHQRFDLVGNAICLIGHSGGIACHHSSKNLRRVISQCVSTALVH